MFSDALNTCDGATEDAAYVTNSISLLLVVFLVSDVAFVLVVVVVGATSAAVLPTLLYCFCC